MPKTTERLDEDSSLAQKSDFSFDQMFMKKDMRWHLRIKLAFILPKLYDKYMMKFEFDPSYYNTSIEQIEKTIARKGDQGTIVDNGEIDQLRREIASIEKERDGFAEQCTTFTTEAILEEVKNKGGSLITVRIPDTIVEEINAQREYLDKYIVILEPKV